MNKLNIFLLNFMNFIENYQEFSRPKFLIPMGDVEGEEGSNATFKVKVEYGYPKARVLFYRNDQLILPDKNHLICKLLK